jgi:hypothetical protein
VNGGLSGLLRGCTVAYFTDADLDDAVRSALNA